MTPDQVSKASATAQPRNINELDETRWERTATNLRTIVVAVLFAFVLRTCLFEAFEIEGPSMEPTLLGGDRVVVSKYAFGLFLPLRDHADITWGSPNVGDVVILKSPADGVDIIKRVIGVAGDLIEVHADRVYRNGIALPATEIGSCVTGTGAQQNDCRVYESKIADHPFHISSAHISPDPFSTRVPPDHFYVLGDHRDHSNDSRNQMIGAIPINRIRGRALAIYWSSGPEGFRWNRMFSAIH